MNNKNVRVVLGVSFNIVLIIVGAIIIFAAGSKAYTFGHNIFNEESVDTEENARQVEVVISDGISAKQLSSILYDKGLCRDKIIMYFQIVLSDYNNNFVGGTYTLDTAMKPSEMMEIMCQDTGEDS